VFSWFRKFRRRSLQARPFPPEWSEIVSRNVPSSLHLPAEQQHRLRQAIHVWVAEKNWEGCGGLLIEDEHRVTIAAHAARLMLGFEDDYVDEVVSILVYPSAYEAHSREYLGGGVVLEGPSSRAGEAWRRGPVILSWPDVLGAGRFQRRHQNVVLHEFAHQLDMRNGGAADGIPVIESASEADEWRQVTGRDFDRLSHLCHVGMMTMLDCYGATNAAEFFAVATEAFFESPARLAIEWTDLYRVLSRFYRQQLG